MRNSRNPNSCECYSLRKSEIQICMWFQSWITILLTSLNYYLDNFSSRSFIFQNLNMHKSYPSLVCCTSFGGCSALDRLAQWKGKKVGKHSSANIPLSPLSHFPFIISIHKNCQEILNTANKWMNVSCSKHICKIFCGLFL